MTDVTSSAAAARVGKERAEHAAGDIHSTSEDMQRATVYLPKATVKALKQAALDRNTSMSKILTELADRWLAEVI